ncbi:polymer-forming cytoskeletal protein [Acidocella sp.]|uniref:bactofilin family protein n=1 Tax=Acidocella sp. TaxID=50710 RepID=UPI0026201697|nr:polymer-forming cytoskeletal protein [Acidocella sp.]
MSPVPGAEPAAPPPAEAPAPKPATADTPPMPLPGAALSARFKESPMARSPFAPPSLPVMPTAVPGRQPLPGAQREADDRRTLTIGKGITINGTIADAERLVVEGTIEAGQITGLAELVVAPGGLFKGDVEVDEADIAGTIDGTVTTRRLLTVRSAGQVLGTARCKRLAVEDGGQIQGRIEMIPG